MACNGSNYPQKVRKAALNTFYNLPSSYLSVFNNFRADFEDFTLHVTDSNLQHFTNVSLNDTNRLKNLHLSWVLFIVK